MILQHISSRKLIPKSTLNSKDSILRPQITRCSPITKINWTSYITITPIMASWASHLWVRKMTVSIWDPEVPKPPKKDTSRPSNNMEIRVRIPNQLWTFTICRMFNLAWTRRLLATSRINYGIRILRCSSLKTLTTIETQAVWDPAAHQRSSTILLMTLLMAPLIARNPSIRTLHSP